MSLPPKTARWRRSLALLSLSFALPLWAGDRAVWADTVQVPQLAQATGARASVVDLFDSGIARTRAGQYRQAISDFDRVLAANPQLAEAWFNRAGAKAKVGDNLGAVADYGQFLKLKPGSSDAYLLRASARYDLGDQRGSCTDLKKAASLGNNAGIRALGSPAFAWCRSMP